MILENNTLLITGGSDGIGLALAKRFAKKGNKVIICGRREEQLENAKKSCPELITIQCDVSSEEERIKLFQKITRDFPAINILINNAGIQNRPAPLTQTQDWNNHKREIAINYEAPMHLSMLFIPHLAAQKNSYIMNVSSGLAFAPLAFMSTYCSTKAALHSFTMSLRHQLKDTSIKVVEIIPPKVNTDLGGKGLHDDGAPLNDFADHCLFKLEAGDTEFGYMTSEKARLASREDIDKIFSFLNSQSIEVKR